LNVEIEGVDVEVIEKMIHEIQYYNLKFFMVSFEAFNFLYQESYDVERVANDL
jgi:hypothetical protein